jgi:hypothetical protein
MSLHSFPQPRNIEDIFTPGKQKQVLIKKRGHRFIPHVKSQELEEVGNQTPL